jgi:hypothetical protein
MTSATAGFAASAAGTEAAEDRGLATTVAAAVAGVSSVTLTADGAAVDAAGAAADAVGAGAAADAGSAAVEEEVEVDEAAFEAAAAGVMAVSSASFTFEDC